MTIVIICHLGGPTAQKMQGAVYENAEGCTMQQLNSPPLLPLGSIQPSSAWSDSTEVDAGECIMNAPRSDCRSLDICCFICVSPKKWSKKNVLRAETEQHIIYLWLPVSGYVVCSKNVLDAVCKVVPDISARPHMTNHRKETHNSRANSTMIRRTSKPIG